MARFPAKRAISIDLLSDRLSLAGNRDRWRQRSCTSWTRPPARWRRATRTKSPREDPQQPIHEAITPLPLRTSSHRPPSTTPRLLALLHFALRLVMVLSPSRAPRTPPSPSSLALDWALQSRGHRRALRPSPVGAAAAGQPPAPSAPLSPAGRAPGLDGDPAMTTDVSSDPASSNLEVTGWPPPRPRSATPGWLRDRPQGVVDLTASRWSRAEGR